MQTKHCHFSLTWAIYCINLHKSLHAVVLSHLVLLRQCCKTRHHSFYRFPWQLSHYISAEMEGRTAEERRGAERWALESKGEGKANEGSGGESQTAGKRRKKNTGMSSETINTCMLERERERAIFSPWLSWKQRPRYWCRRSVLTDARHLNLINNNWR